RFVPPPLAPPGDRVDPVCLSSIDALVRSTSSVDAALTVDLKTSHVVALDGPRGPSLDVARAMLCQLAVMHSPDDVRIRLDTQSPADWDWMKWLPHVRANGAVGRTVTVTDGASILIGTEPGDPKVRIDAGGRNDRLGAHAAEAIARALAPLKAGEETAVRSA